MKYIVKFTVELIEIMSIMQREKPVMQRPVLTFFLKIFLMHIVKICILQLNSTITIQLNFI